MKPELTLIAAMDEHRLIATARGIPWHLPRDIQQYRDYTHGKWLLLGRRTYDEMRGWFRPGHWPLVLTHKKDWKSHLGAVVRDVAEAMRMTEEAGKPELVCCGGGQVFEAAMPFATRMVLTRIQHAVSVEDGAVYFPSWNESKWETVSEITHAADNENSYAISFLTLRRR